MSTSATFEEGLSESSEQRGDLRSIVTRDDLFLDLFIPARGHEPLSDVCRRAAKHTGDQPESAERKIRRVLQGASPTISHHQADCFLLAVGVVCRDLPAFPRSVDAARRMIREWSAVTGNELKRGEIVPLSRKLHNFSRGFLLGEEALREEGSSDGTSDSHSRISDPRSVAA